MGTFGILGISLYLYLPIRAVASPDLNWGDPSSWGRFTFNFLRTQYQQAEGTGTVGVWMRQWIQFAKATGLEFPALLLPALAGAAAAWKDRRPFARGMLLAWGSLAFVLGVYLNLTQDRYHLIGAYALSGHVFIILFAAWAAAAWIARAPADALGWKGRRGRGRLALIVLLALLVPFAALRWTRSRQTDYTFTWDYNLNVWRCLPRDALYFVRGDSIVFPNWYFQWVGGLRRDLAVIGVDGLPMRWVRVVLERDHPGLKVPFPERQVPFVGNESIPPMVRFLFYANRGRGSWFSYNKIEDESVPEAKLVPYGLAYQGVLPALGGALPALDEARVERAWSGVRFRHLEDRGESRDVRTREHLLKDYAVIRNGLGVYYEDLADAEIARAKKEKREPSPKILEHDYQGCYEAFLWAHEWAPRDHEFAFNVGNSLFHLGRIAESTAWYELSTELDPVYPDSYYNWGVAEYQRGNYQRAGELFDQTLALDPDKKEADDAVKYMLYKGMYRRPRTF